MPRVRRPARPARQRLPRHGGPSRGHRRVRARQAPAPRLRPGAHPPRRHAVLARPHRRRDRRVGGRAGRRSDQQVRPALPPHGARRARAQAGQRFAALAETERSAEDQAPA